VILAQQCQFSYSARDFSLSIPEFKVNAGESVAIIGASGSGKTTFLNLLSGLMPVTSGEISIAGEKITEMNDFEMRAFRIANIGIIFQDFSLINYLSVLNNVILPYRINNSLQLNKAVRRYAIELLEKFDIADKSKRLINRLSRGEQQRVAICRALITRPRLIIADEATENLDPNNKKLAYQVLFDYIKSNNAVLISVTHDHSHLENFDNVFNFDTLNLEVSA